MVGRSEALIPLTSGAYKSRNNIASDSICENCFPEINPDNVNSPVPMTHYQKEGLNPLSSPPAQGMGRGIFALSTGQLIAVAGSTVYTIDQNWGWTSQGTIPALNTPVSVTDNGSTAMIVDGTSVGYQLVLNPYSFSQIVDATGTFVGATRVDFSDTYIAFNMPGTNGWGVTNPNSISFNAFQVANKDSTPDPIVTLAFNLRVAWLLGAQNSEIWFLAGSTPFPYNEWPNIFIPYGCVAPYSVARSDVTLFWLGRNAQGQTIALGTRGYAVETISTRALEYEWSNYPIVSDVVTSTFQRSGHVFVLFHFPSADKTWVYDLSTKQWHARTWIDANGKPHRDRCAFHASVGTQGGFPTTIVGQDWSTGQLYAVSSEAFTDNGVPIVCRRSFPHVIKDMNEVTLASFVADFSAGTAIGLPNATYPAGSDFNSDFNNDFGPSAGAVFVPQGPALCMRYSKDGGSTWSNYRQKGLIASGDYRKMMRWRGLGMGRDWVFELLWTYPGQNALQGAYIPGAIEHGA